MVYFECDWLYRQYRKDLRANSRAVSKLRVAAETCKRVLSTVGSSQCSVDSLYEGIDFNSTLSRSDNCVLHLRVTGIVGNRGQSSLVICGITAMWGSVSQISHSHGSTGAAV